jgi:hypothetical protein
VQLLLIDGDVGGNNRGGLRDGGTDLWFGAFGLRSALFHWGRLLLDLFG